MRSRLIAVPYLVWLAIFIVVPMLMVVFFAFTDLHTGEFTLANMALLRQHKIVPAISSFFSRNQTGVAFAVPSFRWRKVEKLCDSGN